MTALYSHTTRAVGATLTASIYNADHQNHITNGIPSQLDDYSASVAEMQTTADPGEVGSESQAGSLSGEIERLRFAIQEIKSALDPTLTRWYQSLTSPNGRAAYPPKWIEGLDLTVKPSSNSYIEVATGSCRDSTDTINMVVSSALHRSASTVWVTAATGGGRGNSATLGNKELHHVFVFKTGASTIDIGTDTTLTASNLQARASMTYFRRIGSILTGTAGLLLSNVQRDGYVIYNGIGQQPNASYTATWSGVTVLSTVKLILVPTGFPVRAKVAVGSLGISVTSIFLRVLDFGPSSDVVMAAYPVAWTQTSSPGGLSNWHFGDYWTGPCGDVMAQSNTPGVSIAFRCVGYYDRRRD